VLADGRDISETPFDLGMTDVNNVVVTFTDRPTKVAGSAVTGDGNPDGDAIVIAFPVDQAAWSDVGVNSRRVRSTHAARDGSYTIAGLPPGEYCVVAIHEDTTPEWQDSRVLEVLARSGGNVRLTDGDTHMLSLKTVTGSSR
jgi:hypothetical protein